MKPLKAAFRISLYTFLIFFSLTYFMPIILSFSFLKDDTSIPEFINLYKGIDWNPFFIYLQVSTVIFIVTYFILIVKQKTNHISIVYLLFQPFTQNPYRYYLIVSIIFALLWFFAIGFISMLLSTIILGILDIKLGTRWEQISTVYFGVPVIIYILFIYLAVKKDRVNIFAAIYSFILPLVLMFTVFASVNILGKYNFEQKLVKSREEAEVAREELPKILQFTNPRFSREEIDDLQVLVAEFDLTVKKDFKPATLRYDLSYYVTQENLLETGLQSLNDKQRINQCNPGVKHMRLFKRGSNEPLYNPNSERELQPAGIYRLRIEHFFSFCTPAEIQSMESLYFSIIGGKPSEIIDSLKISTINMNL